MDNDEQILKYTHMNVRRMKRGDNTFKLNEELRSQILSAGKKMTWLIITEGWCGDAAQLVSAFVHIAGADPSIEVKFVLRDEHPELMDAFLTKGTRSIPKLIILERETLEVLATWGPRPAEAQKLTDDYKNKGVLTYDEYAVQLHTWYAKDKYQSVQEEIKELLKTIS